MDSDQTRELTDPELTELLAQLADDGPTEDEMTAMLAALPECPSSPEGGTDRLAQAEAGASSPPRRGYVGPMIAAGIAVAACLGIAYQIGHWHYGAQIRPTASTANVPVSSPAIMPSGAHPTAPAATRSLWMLTSRGDADVSQIATPTAPAEARSEIVSDMHQEQMGPPSEEATDPFSVHDWQDAGRISFGYQAPFGDGEDRSSTNWATRIGVMADEGPHAGNTEDDEEWKAFSPQPYGSRVLNAPAANENPFMTTGSHFPESSTILGNDGASTDDHGADSVVVKSARPDGFEEVLQIIEVLENAQTEKSSSRSTLERSEVEAGVPVLSAVPRLAEQFPSGQSPEEQRGPETAPGSERASSAAPVTKIPAASPAKIIKTGELDFAVPEYQPAYERVKKIVQAFEAFVADVRTEERTGGAMTAQVSIRVAPGEFEALFEALKAVGELESENVKARDVTAQYVDLQARIKAGQITEARLHELIKKKSIIDKISAVLEVERELRRVRGEIEQMQGRLRVMADRVAHSTITVTLREPPRVVPSASLSVQVEVLADAADRLGAAAEKLGGRLASGKVSRGSRGAFKGDYKLEVTLGRFDDLLRAVESLGRVQDRRVNDRRFSDDDAPWAEEVQCSIALVLVEVASELPKGNVTLEVDAVGPALAALNDLLDEHDARVVSNHATRRDDGSSVADVRLSVPAGRFGGLASALDALGRITARELSGDGTRVSGGAANMLCDLALRVAERPRQVPSGSLAVEVEDFEGARGRISALVAEHGVHVLSSASAKRTDGTTVGEFRLGISAAGMETLVDGLEALGHVVQRSIVGVGLGDLSTIDPTALAVIKVSIGEKAAIAPSPERAGDSIRAKLTDGLAALYRSLGLIVFGLTAMAPWLAIVVLAAWLVARSVRRRRARAAS